MNEKENNPNRKHDGLKWVARVVISLGPLIPLLYIMFYFLVIKQLGPRYWSYLEFSFYIFLFVITTISWFAPVFGGITTVIVALFRAAYVSIGTAWATSGSGPLLDSLTVFDSLLLVVGGILSIIWGVRHRKRINREHN
ncbi:MAG: hypothetical protein PHE50_08580 [Dehalococcoidales bacterium]|nr:hypothetical protein [Dehalococcoidales bacterium]